MRSGTAAAAWLEQRTAFPLDEDGITQCMRAVLMAFDLVPIDGYGSAMDGWRLNGIPSTIGSASFVRGTVHYFRGPFGHVGIATGNGTEIRSTGVGTTRMLTATAAEMARLTGDPYLGYATSFSGRPIDLTSSAGSAGIPITEVSPTERDDMPQRYALKGSSPRRFFLGGASPGTIANWLMTEDEALAVSWLPLNNAGLPIGGYLDRSQSQIDELAKFYLTPSASIGSVTVKPDPDLLAAVKAGTAATVALGTKIDALPAEIDRYADGKKQS